MLLKILSFLFLVPGFGLAVSARTVVKKYKLDQSIKTHTSDEMDEEELQRHKFNTAVVNLKMLGMLIALPGIILVLLAFK